MAAQEPRSPMRLAPGGRKHVKVRADRIARARLPWHANVAALASALVALLGLFPTTAHAITRTDVLTRAHTWVVRRVSYSQTSRYAGYRRDCSGYVSMAWQLGRSYTSRTIHAVATRVAVSRLQPGDAVHTPGHVALFVAWANRAHTRYVAMEESEPGRPALHHVVSLERGATGLRYRHITEDASLTVAATPPLTGISPMPGMAGAGSLDTTASTEATGSVTPTAAASVLATGTAAASASAAPTLFFAPASRSAGAFALVPLS
jgi:hypothetical protein